MLPKPFISLLVADNVSIIPAYTWVLCFKARLLRDLSILKCVDGISKQILVDVSFNYKYYSLLLSFVALIGMIASFDISLVFDTPITIGTSVVVV